MALIKITIQAPTGGGKSTIATIITEALQEAGFQNVVYEDEDEALPVSWHDHEGGEDRCGEGHAHQGGGEHTDLLQGPPGHFSGCP